jgi:putative spermidine/putrescine transport system permease protein
MRGILARMTAAIPFILGVAVFVFLLGPIVIVVVMSFSGGDFLQFPPTALSLRWYSNFFNSVEWMDAARISAATGVLTVLVSVPLGFLAAYGLSNLQGRARSVVFGWLLVPLIVPTILLAVGIFYIYAQLGLINTIFGLVIAHSALAIPFVVVTMLASFAQVDFQLEKAARSLGAPAWYAVLTITTPIVKRGIFASALIALLTSLDEVVIALLITLGEKSTLTRRMFTSIRDQYDPTIAAISTLLITLSILAAASNLRSLRQSRT